MKILFSVPRYHPNHDGLVLGLQDAGHRLAFLVRARHPTERHRPGVEVIDLERRSPLIPPVRFLWRVLRRIRPDVVVARNPDRVSYALYLLCKLLGIPYFLYVQRTSGYEEIRFWRRLMLRLGLWPRHTLNAICPDPPRIPGKTCDFLPFAMETAGFGKTRYPDAPPIAVLAVGKLDQPRKNHLALVRHTAPMLREGRIRLTLLGLRDPAGSPAFAALQAEIADRGVAEAVRIVENLDHAASRRLYAEHDLLVLAGSRERASVAPVEALAAGLPAICGSDNGTNFFVRPGETGFVFPDGDFEEMARLIDGFADRPDEIRRMGLAGRRMIESEYSPAAAARRFEGAVARRFPRAA